MKGDFSRSSFDPQKHYSSVRMQQGRVQLDADWNEQADITLHQLRTQLEDLIGNAGGVQSRPGFIISHPAVESSKLDFKISAGHSYVDGILCINEKPCQFTEQNEYPHASQIVQSSGKGYIAYLDVWERHLTALEDSEIGEVALNGIDTATRTKTIWQVKVTEVDISNLPQDETERREFLQQTWQEFLREQPGVGKLSVSHDSKSRIQQNQLYRVEIHDKHDAQVTFKWSRENGSVVYAVEKITPQSEGVHRYEVTLKPVDTDKLYLERGDWTEISDDNDIRLNQTRSLLKVIDVQKDTGIVILESAGSDIPENLLKDAQHTHTLLRRWDQQERSGQKRLDGAIIGEEAYEVELENGINIKFAKSNDCRIGDYWLIPARGDLSDGMGGILWDNKTAQPPHGTKHHFAPFAFIYPAESAWQASEWHDLRFRTVPILSREVDDLTRRVTESEEAIVELTTRTKQDIEELTKRVQSLEQKKWDLQLVEWLMTAMAVLLLLLLIYYGVKGSWWLFVIIVLIGGGLFWARQKLHPSKGDGASK